MTAINLDREFYVVMQATDEAFFSETILGDSSKEKVLSDLLAYQYDHPVAVVRFNPGEGTSSDESEWFAEKWLEKILSTADETTTLPEFVSEHVADAEDRLWQIHWELQNRRTFVNGRGWR